MNLEYQTEISQFTSALSDSTLQVTLTDPYMTGVAWAALFDSAAAYGNVSQAAANHIMLPACQEGEEPASGKCRPFPEIEDPNLHKSLFGSFAHIRATLWYEVAGTKFALDTYFRLQSFRITHGRSYPQVTLLGVQPQMVAFNQTLSNFQLKENETLENNLKTIIEQEFDHRVTFCTDPTGEESVKTYLMPRSFKEKNVTAEEVISKYVKSVGGTYQALPTKEYVNKISLCTRANINQGCSVFYLGKGLYEGYELSGQVDSNLLNANAEYDTYRGLGYNYNKDALGEDEIVTINDIYPQRRKAKFEKARTDLVSFNGQFGPLDKRLSDAYTNSQFIWEGGGPEVTTKRARKVNMYGISVTGNEPIALLDGTVQGSLSKDNGRVVIATNYFLRFCGENDKCRNKPIYQETVNLATIEDNITPGTEVEMNQKLGTATAERPEFVRFYIPGSISTVSQITISPSIVWKYAVPVKKLTDEERKKIGLEETGNPQSPSSPDQGERGIFVGRVGSTGRSTGAHLHVQWADGRFIDIDMVKKYVDVAGNVGSLHGEVRPTGTHKGVDINGNDRAPIYLINGATLNKVAESKCTVESDEENDCGKYLGNHVYIDTPEGQMILAHLAPGTVNNAAVGAKSGSRYGTGVQTAPATTGAEIQTEFKGIPRALRIVPGRTVLSLVTRYDEWIEKGRPTDIDPGIWIAGRFSKWFVKNVRYTWSQGDLRVSLTGVTDWGNTTAKIQVPTFEDYVRAFQSTSEFEYTKDYYGYIRSLGDLCWKLKDGKNSCEVFCKEAQDIQNFLNIGREGSADMSGNFPNAQCTYKGALSEEKKRVANQIMGMLRSVGINSKNAYAGVIGNAITESSLEPNRHNGSRPGTGCTRAESRSQILGSTAYGLFQLCGSRADEIAARGCGRNCNLQQQLEFTANEIKTGRNISSQCVRRNWIKEINEASTPERAAEIWNECYEGGDPSNRSKNAADVAKVLDCITAND